jgi:hypothetical protein
MAGLLSHFFTVGKLEKTGTLGRTGISVLPSGAFHAPFPRFYFLNLFGNCLRMPPLIISAISKICP